MLGKLARPVWGWGPGAIPGPTPLFCGSDRGGRAAAVHFSLLASCKRHGHDPWVYYRDVLTRLPAMLPGASEEDLLVLLPHLWKPA